MLNYALFFDNEFDSLFETKELAKLYADQCIEELEINDLDIPKVKIKKVKSYQSYVPNGSSVEAYYDNKGTLLAVRPQYGNEFIDFGFLVHVSQGLEEQPNTSYTHFIKLGIV